MVAVQTFWLKKNDKNWHNWGEKKNLMVSCSLSFFLLKRIFKKVNLVCNELGKKFLTEELGLRFDNIHIIQLEEEKLNDFVWSINKIYSYSIQNEPFIHVDTDFFMFDKPSKEFFDSEIFAQNLEIDHPIYTILRKSSLDLGLKLPEFILETQYPAVALNVGIIGGRNLSFFKEYFLLAKSIISDNRILLERHAESFKFFYLFLEQHILYEAMKKRKLNIRTLTMPSFRSAYDHITSFRSGVNKSPFVHLIGNYKQKPELVASMHQELQNLWPDQYEFI
jgi:hypothetical protein